MDFDENEQIAIVEIGLPDCVHKPPVKWVELKSGIIEKELSNKEKKEIIPKIHPAIILRTAYEIFRNDNANKIKVLVVNGWIKFDDPATGKNRKEYIASLMVERDQIINMDIQKLEP